MSSSSFCSSAWTCRWSLRAAAWASSAWKKTNVSFIHFNNISYPVLLCLFPQCGHAVCGDKLSEGRRLFNLGNFILRLSLSPHLPWRLDIFWPLMTGNWAAIKLHWCQAELMIVYPLNYSSRHEWTEYWHAEEDNKCTIWGKSCSFNVLWWLRLFLWGLKTFVTELWRDQSFNPWPRQHRGSGHVLLLWQICTKKWSHQAYTSKRGTKIRPLEEDYTIIFDLKGPKWELDTKAVCPEASRLTWACATFIWVVIPLWSSRLSFTWGICASAELISWCRRWLSSSVRDSFSWAWSSLFRSSSSCLFSSATSLMRASCSGRRGEIQIRQECNKVLDSLFWRSNTASRCYHRPSWTASVSSCCFQSAMLSTSLPKILFFCLSVWRASSAHCLSASSRSIRYMTSPRTSFIFLNSGVNGQLSSGWETIQELYSLLRRVTVW